MMQIVHHYNGVYPFGLEKESENTFMQVSKTDLSEDQIVVQRQKGKIYKSINSLHFVKLIKTLKEDENLHFIYQYYDKSVETYIENLKKDIEGPLSKDKYKSLITEFKNNIDNIIDILVKWQIKTDMNLSSIACSSEETTGDHLLLKAFIDPDAEYLSIIQHSYRSKDGKKKDKSGVNQQYLNQFYEAERKRLMLDFEELLQKIFGKQQQNQMKKQFPNFIISGTKLVFSNSDDKEINSQGSREKVLPKINSQQTGVSEKNRSTSPSGEKEFVRQTKEIAQTHLGGTKGSKEFTGPIIDFNQSFEPQFRPEEFLKDKTYIYQENDYLNSLEEELNNMGLEKKENITKKSNPSEVYRTIGAKQKVQVKGQVNFFDAKRKKSKDLTNSQGSTQNNTYNINNPTSQSNQNNLSKESASLSNKSNLSNSSLNNDSSGMKGDSRQIKMEKMNKYKMKVITSHQIEIEGEGNEQPNVEQIQKQILQQIKAGKIDIKDLGGEKYPQLMIGCKSQKDDSREQPVYTISMYNSDHREEKTANQNSNKERAKEDYDGVNNSKSKVISSNKMKNISSILQKIGVKNSNSSFQHNRKYAETHHSQVNSKTEPQYQYKKSSHYPSIPNTHTPQHRMEKSEKLGEEKKTQKYSDKMREAKSKAQQLLKQFSKKK